MPEAFLRFWKKGLTFTGRASRSEYWWWVVWSFVIAAGIAILQAVSGSLDFLDNLWSLATCIPMIALSIRRLHDTNRSGWWLLVLYLAPFVCFIATAVSVALVAGVGISGGFGVHLDQAISIGALLLALLIIVVGLATGILGIVFLAGASDPLGTRFDAPPTPPAPYGNEAGGFGDGMANGTTNGTTNGTHGPAEFNDRATDGMHAPSGFGGGAAR